MADMHVNLSISLDVLPGPGRLPCHRVPSFGLGLPSSSFSLDPSPFLDPGGVPDPIDGLGFGRRRRRQRPRREMPLERTLERALSAVIPFIPGFLGAALTAIKSSAVEQAPSSWEAFMAELPSFIAVGLEEIERMRMRASGGGGPKANDVDPQNPQSTDDDVGPNQG